MIQGGFRCGSTAAPQPLYLDLRQRIATAVVKGGTVRAVADRFGVSATTAVRLGQKARAGLELGPHKSGGSGRPVLVGAVAEWVRERLKAKPDLTMRGPCGRVRHTRHAGIARHGLALRARRRAHGLKKTLIASEQERPAIARFRTHPAGAALLALSG